MYYVLRKCAVFCAVILLSSCQNATPDFPNYPAVHFTDAPFSLDVGTIELVQEYAPPLTSPHLEHIAPITPSSMVRTWANDRLKAVGRNRTLKVIIQDASIIAQPLPRTSGLEGMFTKDESALYSGHLQVKLEIYENDPLFPVAEITANISNSISVAEDAPINDRQQLLYNISKKMIEELNKQIEQNISQYFNRYIIVR